MSEPWRGVEWVADYLGVSTKFVYRHAAELGGRRCGSRLLFRQSEVDAYLDSQRLGPIPLRTRRGVA